ncbi:MULTISPECIES: Bug family tripartite tricarboxylate transporter substrate binding protein [Achromobacter]|uniref:Tripartite tricarboxylate transporter substrate binding protein n=1 Tax=Achromobacter spanius TaxID=217203 RepID=A0ABY8GWJ0_9BURK|nr:MULTISPECIES: tripartite tricarboxylate transporter substrate binding protein [Achromobacter]WAI81530.1 tripartite tricarboxylate transporter substrate binding protein [Achromobacter spanius]WEX97047.1 tripartite tricarboxylate transporter substrate binding protein [Achromobacter sp. SS2-2022]WFP09236.1 tripartite tricarboxylate transporter substrate binding protein [Achromobacter spanius]
MRFPIRRWACGALASACSAAVMAAAPYPDKPIRLIVPWPAGGSADTIGRSLGDALGKHLNATVVVENMAGASGTIATTQFARAAPDGYTLLLASSSANVSAPNLYAKVHFDPIKDFAPIGEVALVPSVLIVPEHSPFKRPADIVAAARKQPGKLTYGSGGIGNSGHLSGELFRAINKIEVTHVPYKGNNPALTDLMGGRLDYMFDNGAIGHIQSQRVSALAVAADARLKAIPDVPTFEELGMAGMQLTTWFGLAAPAGTPGPIVDKLSSTLNAVMSDPAYAQRLIAMGAELRQSTPAAFTTFWAQELERYRQLVQSAGIQVN